MNQEQALIEQIRQGDQEAFAQLVTQYETPVYNLCLRMTGHPEDALDLSQEAFLKAWRGLSFYKFESSFSTWLYRLTTNVCIDFLRSQKRKQTLSLTVREDEETVELEVPDSGPLPEEQVINREHTRTVSWAMNQLEEEFRTILTLRVLEDLSYEEIGEILDLKPGTVKSRLARARLKLKKILESGNNLEIPSSNPTEGGRHGDL